ncbi:hypothetical protein CENSYa_0851 [Cenarchaeum symbiosum A]|uniref:Uncharacterized protein n=1 Tax=Cenarchaeum symbiosum (strain A) TaxID=414004 RepID=A0RVW7_CENSY|nr:hypothetical protein CENSYa_0851 [Cenarchaeum symbiosum A]
MTGIAIGLLLLYGADVAAIMAGEGFIPLDHRARGMILGLPSIVLPVAAFFVSRKEPSKGLGAMIVIAAALVIAGGAAIMAMPSPDGAEGRNPAMEGGPLLIVGAFIAVLGAIKLKKS